MIHVSRNRRSVRAIGQASSTFLATKSEAQYNVSNMTTRTKHEPAYAGTCRSAIARAKRILVKAGIDWSSSGYTPGVGVVRMGVCSKVLLHAHTGYLSAQERQDLQNRALATLRAAGMQFDDQYMLSCARDMT